MKVKINRNAAKVLKRMLLEDGSDKKVRIYISHMHGDHAHYGMSLDTPGEHDVIVQTDKDVDIILDSREEFLDGIWIQYFFVEDEGFVITNPTKGHHHHH
ncbi:MULTISPECIES: heme biosynthesis protein HemY [Oceanobacillus]|uniref:heme biosynthesis protein HemY n=1 Tax=Oceanobacillus TaxID=182709 RepID=UPI0003644DC7|nr:heme biosynthesis protein HemY [Oceanobacillus kimchii]